MSTFLEYIKLNLQHRTPTFDAWKLTRESKEDILKERMTNLNKTPTLSSAEMARINFPQKHTEHYMKVSEGVLIFLKCYH